MAVAMDSAPARRSARRSGEPRTGNERLDQSAPQVVAEIPDSGDGYAGDRDFWIELFRAATACAARLTFPVRVKWWITERTSMVQCCGAIQRLSASKAVRH
ncbi:hypothetical protein BOX37_24530 [Nocardia mangyaensis]|uniref:Uncharacterized protein n=1 Tax=Nocardia mangyaensis TaxID=2213200 RepID=A0A1J0VX32_9NOCA|nr:hypothetical protein BOX37_24530 [Nocardia mangyaensis]